jgi:nucleoside-diphosphate-sugar epimerase
MLLSIPPDDNGDPAFNFHGEDIATLDSLQWAGLLSTTSVYGDRDGGWVDEDSEQRPTNKRGSRRSLAEAQWLSLHADAANEKRFPIQIFRLAGIYGPGRSALDAVRAGNSRRINKPGHAFNRVHIDDIVGTLIASMAHPNPGRAYNVSDDEPAPSFEVIGMAADLLGMTPGPIIPFDQADQAPMARSFYLDNKRVKNDRIKQELGVTLKHPTYREGLKACLDAERANRTPAPIFMGGEGL